MKTCQNCHTRSKDDAVECIHCGDLFGKAPNSGSVSRQETPAQEESAVKQTLFGIPAQKLEDLLAARDQNEDLSKKTMAGFNVAGLFGDNEIEKIKPAPAFHDDPVDPEEGDTIPGKIETSGPLKTMAGLNVSGLFKDVEDALQEEPVAKEEAPAKEEEPKFGTMLGINIADIAAYSGGNEEKKSDPTATLFSLPAVDSPTVKGKAPSKLTGPSGKTDTAAGGVRAVIKNQEKSSFSTKTPSKVSLGSLIPKMTLQKKDKAPILAARPAVQTPVEFVQNVSDDTPKPTQSGASGILRKSKSSSSKSDPKRKSGVLGSYVVGKESLNAEASISPADVNESKETDSIIAPEPAVEDPTIDEAPPSIEVVDVEEPKKIDTPLPETPAMAEKAPTVTEPVEVEKKAKKASGNYEGSIGTVQLGFVLFGSVIILGAIAALFAKDQKSMFNLFSTGISAVALLGSLGALFGTKNEVVKGSIWTLSALVLFAIGLIGVVLGTPLNVLFIFAGLVFLFSALFRKIVSLL